MKNDPELRDKLISVSYIDSYNPFTEGLYIINLDENQINIYGKFIYSQLVKNKHNNSNYQITCNASTMLRCAIFAVGTSKQQNPDWKEHCASSLREILHGWVINVNYYFAPRCLKQKCYRIKFVLSIPIGVT